VLAVLPVHAPRPVHAQCTRSARAVLAQCTRSACIPSARGHSQAASQAARPAPQQTRRRTHAARAAHATHAASPDPRRRTRAARLARARTRTSSAPRGRICPLQRRRWRRRRRRCRHRRRGRRPRRPGRPSRYSPTRPPRYSRVGLKAAARALEAATVCLRGCDRMWQAELKSKFGSKADAGPLYTLVYDTKFARQHGQKSPSWQRQSRPPTARGALPL
jgi:hypothetical protein